ADHASGGLMPLPDGTPGHAIFYVQVDDVAATSKRVEELGGKVVLPATKTPDGLEFSHVTDAEGNRFGLWNPSAG
ncbi:MAG: VOC family protein, partial [Sciscionella sp.]|nr:VOC family protein [Sciscionella sp.]